VAPKATSGSTNVAPQLPGSYIYGLSCIGPRGSASGSATLSAAFETSVATQAGVPLPAPEVPNSALSGALSKVQSFELMVGNTPGTSGINQAIGASTADVVFLNLCSTDPPIDRAVADPTGTKLLFGYVDIGEAFACAEPQLFTGTLPTWFGNINPGYAGLYTVQYWNPAWETALDAQIDRNMADGLDGIFIDLLTADEEWSADNGENNPVYANATSALATLLGKVRTYIKTNYPGKTVYLVGNNPHNIALQYPASLTNLDGIFNEYSFFTTSASNGTVEQTLGPNYAAQVASTYAPAYATAHVPVFGNDYPSPVGDLAEDLQSMNFYMSLGWVSSVQTPVRSDSILSSGPFMFTATPNNPSVTGTSGFINLLSGGVAADATLTGGDQGDTFVGGPGRNTITGGGGNDTIYAHPVYAGYKGRLIVTLSSENKGSVTAAPTVAISVNGKTLFAATPITAPYNTNVQVFSVNVSTLAPVSSVVLTVAGTNDIDASDNSQVVIQGILYDGVAVNLAAGTYSNGADSNGFTYSHNGTVSFAASAFSLTSPYLGTTSDTINGGSGINTVVYPAASTNYTLAKQANGSWVVTAATTAEGPDTLTNIQRVTFSDKTVTLTN
jgi:endo-alpha-1,4-polygalactosaminidase (GH114 family)